MGKRALVSGRQQVPAKPVQVPVPEASSRRSRYAWMVLITAITTVGSIVVYLAIADRPAPSTPEVISIADPGESRPVRINRPAGAAPEGMVWIPGGPFHMGTSDSHPYFADAQPEHEVEIDGFWMDESELTNEQFAKFVQATCYLTVAEQKPTAEQILAMLPPGSPRPDPTVLVPYSLVFSPPPGPVNWSNPGQWWKPVPSACWKHPEGPGSDIRSRMSHPVVHICYADAEAYAKWARKRLPTEAEWERAARGGFDRMPFVWGEETPGEGGRWRCNIWQGDFPWKNTHDDGFAGTAPVKSFAPNGYGLYDMAGNVWEWCSDWYSPSYYSQSPRRNPQGPERSFDRDEPNPFAPKRVQRGGSFLCSDGFCARYKPAGRGKGAIDTGASHIGFRCAMDARD